jgi:hypothetical protein
MYKLICMSFDGQYTTEGDFKTIDEAWHRSSNIGSRWFLHPFHFVTTEKTIIDSPELLEWTKKKRIKTIQEVFKKNSRRKELHNANIEEFIISLI